MLTHPTIDKLQQLRLTGMVSALTQQSQSADIEDMGFEDRLGLIVDQEMAYRESRQLTTRLRRAKLKEQASPENIDFRSARGLDRMLFQALLGGQWIKRHQNIDHWVHRSWQNVPGLRLGASSLPGWAHGAVLPLTQAHERFEHGQGGWAIRQNVGSNCEGQHLDLGRLGLCRV